jgi:hypothetical protein
MTPAVDHPKATFPAWANLRAPATGHFTYAASRPLLEATISPTCIYATPHSAARANACRSSSFSIETSIPTIFSSTVLVRDATLTAVGTSTFVRCVASCFLPSFLTGHLNYYHARHGLPHSYRLNANLREGDAPSGRGYYFGICRFCSLAERKGHGRRSLYARERGHPRCRRRSCFHCSCAAARFG